LSAALALYDTATPVQRHQIARILRGVPATFREWNERTTPTWRWDWAHVALLQDTLDRVTAGEINRLIIQMPPRHGKSETTTIRYPVYRLTDNPHLRVIIGAYNSTLATKFARKARTIALDSGLGLSEERAAADDWETTEGGGVRAVGVGTGVTGHGGDLIVVDDPVKSREEAESLTYRERVWAWFTDDLWTRREPGAAVVVIMTRWHEDDLAGRLLEHEGSVEEGGQWTVLDLPAISPSGEALWPEWYDLKALERIKNTIGPREWSALYMQRPQPDEGGFFQRAWFQTWTAKPKHLRIYGTSDYAVTDGGGDYTVHRIWGIDEKFNIYRLDGWRGQSTADVWIEEKINLIAKWKPAAWFGEAGVIQKAVAPMLTRRMRERKVFCRMEWIPSINDKPTRARGFQARASMGTVFFEPGADITEFLHFPAGKHDDEVDVAGLIGRVLDETHPALVPVAESSRNPPDLWGRPKGEASSWKTV
jgi:predicted phage terminase large subunit-like protein